MINKIKTHFGFKSIPFAKELACCNLFETPQLRKSYDRLEFALKSGDFAMVTGSPGSGKSSVLRKFCNALDPSVYPYVYITAEQYKIGDIAKLILKGFHYHVPYQSFSALTAYRDMIEKMTADKNIKPLIVIDEAQQLPIKTLCSLKNMVNFNADSDSRVTFLLCGQNEIRTVLKAQELSSLLRRMKIRVLLKPLSLEECIQYIKHQMHIAGCTKDYFTDDCMAEIHKISQGNIGNINNLCFDLLLAAYENQKEVIEPSLIDSVIVE